MRILHRIPVWAAERSLVIECMSLCCLCALAEEVLGPKDQMDAAEPLEVKRARMHYFLDMVPSALARAEADAAAAVAATAEAVKAQVCASGGTWLLVF